MADPNPAPDPKKAEPSREALLVEKLLALKNATGADVRKLARELFPDARGIPAEDADAVVAPVKAEVDALKTQLTEALNRLAEREKADANLRVENEMAVKITNAVKAFGLTDSGREKMIKRMQDTGNVTDADAAAAWVVSQMPKPEPTNAPSWLPTDANLFGTKEKDERFEELHKDPRKYLDNQLREFVRDPDKYVAETFGTA